MLREFVGSAKELEHTIRTDIAIADAHTTPPIIGRHNLYYCTDFHSLELTLTFFNFILGSLRASFQSWIESYFHPEQMIRDLSSSVGWN